MAENDTGFQGAVEDDEEHEGQEQEGTENGSEDAAGPLLKADGTPYTMKDIAGYQEALKKARREARAAKRQDAIAEERGTKSAEDIEKEITQRVESKYRPMLINAAARDALMRANIKPERLAKALKNIEHDDLTLNEDGSVDGLDEQIEELKDEIPEWFPRRRTAPTVDAADRPGDGNRKTKSASELQAEKLLGIR